MKNERRKERRKEGGRKEVVYRWKKGKARWKERDEGGQKVDGKVGEG